MSIIFFMALFASFDLPAFCHSIVRIFKLLYRFGAYMPESFMHFVIPLRLSVAVRLVTPFEPCEYPRP